MSVIAIDGVAASGKSTLARNVARAIDASYHDTGAWYRALSLSGQRQGINLDDENETVTLLAELDISVSDEAIEPGELVSVRVNGEDVSKDVRTPEAGRGAGQVAVHTFVRVELVQRQQQWIANAKKQHAVVEGRDIGSVVCPDAALKLFLVAGQDERTQRRHDDHAKAGTRIEADALEQQIEERDRSDSTKGGLRRVDDAIEVNTTERSPDETLAFVMELVSARI